MSHVLRRTVTAAALAASSAVSIVAVASSASAAGPWFVATTGNNANTCLDATHACLTIAGVLAKSTFAGGDTINLAAGNYAGSVTLTTKGATIVGAGASTTTITASAATYAVGTLLSSNQQLTLQNLTLTGGAFSTGGGLFDRGGPVTLTNVAIAGNSASGASTIGLAPAASGGGIYVNTGGSVTMTGGSITNNTATAGAANQGWGGAAYVGSGGSLTLDGVTVSGNKAVGGSFANSGLGGGVTAVGGTTIKNSTFTGNTAAGTGTTSGYGGAIADASGTPLNLTSTTIDGNGAANATLGGGVYVYNTATVRMSGGAIRNSTATAGAAAQGWGGGAMVAAGGTFTLDGTTVSGNKANGGAFANSGEGAGLMSLGSSTVSNSTFTDNEASGTGSLSGYGGGIYVLQSSSMSLTNTTIEGTGAANAVVGGGLVTGSPVVGTNVTLRNNSALLGGAVYQNGALTLTGSSITGNQATNASLGLGGGVYDATSQPLILDSTTVSGNNAALGGGGITLGGAGTATVRNGSHIDTNTSVYGGGVFSSGALTVTDSSISHNVASYQGGGVYDGSSTSTDHPSLVAGNSHLDANTSAGGGGGALVLDGAAATFTGGSLDGNTSNGGGALAVGDTGTATVDGASLSNNTATTIGGGAVLNAGTTKITHATVVGNAAPYSGSGTLGYGGAIWSGSSTANTGSVLSVANSYLAGNSAYAGAAILTYSNGSGATTKASIDDTTITGNTSASTLGAIEQVGPMTITNSTITNNTAASGSGSSGAVSALAPSTLGVAGTIIAGNSGTPCAGTPVDGGYNLTDVAGCGFSSHRVLGDPKLGAPAANGGPTLSQLPQPTSPALDVVPASTGTALNDAVSGSAVTLCTGSDQRGTARPQGAKCDIGSVEAEQHAPTVSGPAHATLTVGSAMAPLTYTSTGSPQASLSASGVPNGLSFADNHDGTGTLSGTPTTGGDVTVTITATNEAGSGTTTVDLDIHSAPTLSGPSGATYTVGQAGDPQTFTQTGGHPVASLSHTGDLPGGVTLPDGQGSTTLSGTPAGGTGGVWPITVTGTNGTAPDATWPFTLTVDEAAGVTGGTATFTAGTAGSSDPFATTGYPAPTLSAGALPTGLALSGHRITGTPAAGTGGQYDVTLTATNGIGDPGTATAHVTVLEAPAIAGPDTVRLVSGVSATQAFPATGFPAPTVTVAGGVPGMTFVASDGGLLDGTPSAVGDYDLTVTAHNGVGDDAVKHIHVQVVPPVAMSTSPLPDGQVGSSYGAFLGATGGAGTYAFSIVGGSLPAGLTLSASGQITGTPTGPVGTSSFTVQVSDGISTDTGRLSITIGKGITTLVEDPLVLSTSNLLGLRVGTLSATLTGGVPGQPLGGKTVTFQSGTGLTLCTAVTDPYGHAQCSTSLLATLWALLSLAPPVSFAGDETWLPSTAKSGLIGF